MSHPRMEEPKKEEVWSIKSVCAFFLISKVWRYYNVVAVIKWYENLSAREWETLCRNKLEANST